MCPDVMKIHLHASVQQVAGALGRPARTCHIGRMATYTPVQIRDLANTPYWTLIRVPPGELLRSEYRFESEREAGKEAARLTALPDDPDA